jgi:hypothetical protein
MNGFNRFVLIVLCIVIVVAAIAMITLTWTIPNRSVNWLKDAAQWVDDNDGDLEKALLTSISAFLGLVALIVLLIELLPRRGPSVQLTDVAAGSATLSAAAISQRIEEAVVQVPNVAEVRADVKSKRKGILVELDLQVEPEANLATVTDQACQTAQEVLTDRVHVQLLRPPTARLHYRELRLRRGGESTAVRSPERNEAPRAAVADGTHSEGTAAESVAATATASGPPPLPESLARRGGEEDGNPGTQNEETVT